MSVLTRALDRAYALRIMSILGKEFPEWPAFKAGIIDATGSLIKRPKTSEEKSAYTRLDAVLRPVKVALNKFPGGVSALARAYLVKGFLYESSELSQLDYAERMGALAWATRDTDETIRHLMETLVGLQSYDNELCSIFEEMVAGDSGGDAGNIAAGVTSGAVQRPGPETMKKKKKVDKKKDE